MNPHFRNALGVAAACLVAGLIGLKIADGENGLPSLLAVVIIGAILVRLARLPIHAIALGFLLAGYILGNRGFAQLTPVAGLPLLPAELVLALALGWCLLTGAFARRLPFRRDALNWAVLAWLLVGTMRVPFDVPRYGFLALRDYAMCYYALFFFVAQDIARDERSRRFLYAVFLGSALLAVPVFVLFQFFPAFFLQTLTVAGSPLIYHKDDLTVSFIAIGSLLLFHRAEVSHRPWAWPLTAGIFLFVAAGGARAPILGMVAAGLLLFAARRWHYLVINGAVALAGLLAVVALAVLFNLTWAERKLDAFTDRFASVFDVRGTGRYESQDAYFKGDNNRFRLIWWRNVIEESWESNPVFGLGFGADLARGFVQEYYTESGEEFNVRSPHNVIVTTFGRLGAVGVAVWLTFLGTLFVTSWRALRRASAPAAWSVWTAPWVLVVSATFGVVLEGPMGAVIFWTLLGLANSWPIDPVADPTPLPAAVPAPQSETAASAHP